MSDDRYASVPERITWTTGFRVATDKAVLGTLSTFANFRTGRHADMALPTLAARAGFPLRTVERALQRLVADGWITARRRHRRPTVYDICVDRLATHWTAPLSAVDGGLKSVTDKSLSATGDALSAVGGGLQPVLSATGGGPSPVRTDPQLDHKEPALRAVLPEQLTFGPHDIRPPPAPDPNWRQRFADTIRSVLQQNAQRKKHG